MLDQALRSAILVLHAQSHSIRAIARAVKVSRDTVKRVLKAGNHEPPEIERNEKAETYRDEILELLNICKGNLVRVHEKLQDRGAELSYQALTGFCRRHRIGFEPPLPAGRYHFDPFGHFRPLRFTVLAKSRPKPVTRSSTPPPSSSASGSCAFLEKRCSTTLHRIVS